VLVLQFNFLCPFFLSASRKAPVRLDKFQVRFAILLRDAFMITFIIESEAHVIQSLIKKIDVSVGIDMNHDLNECL